MINRSNNIKYRDINVVMQLTENHNDYDRAAKRHLLSLSKYT